MKSWRSTPTGGELCGSLGRNTAEVLEVQVSLLLNRTDPGGVIELDLSGVKAVSPQAVQTFQTLAKHAADKGVTIVLKNSSPQARTGLEAIEQLFTFEQSSDQEVFAE